MAVEQSTVLCRRNAVAVEQSTVLCRRNAGAIATTLFLSFMWLGEMEVFEDWDKDGIFVILTTSVPAPRCIFLMRRDTAEKETAIISVQHCAVWSNNLSSIMCCLEQ